MVYKHVPLEMLVCNRKGKDICTRIMKGVCNRTVKPFLKKSKELCNRTVRDPGL